MGHKIRRGSLWIRIPGKIICNGRKGQPFQRKSALLLFAVNYLFLKLISLIDGWCDYILKNFFVLFYVSIAVVSILDCTKKDFQKINQ